MLNAVSSTSSPCDSGIHFLQDNSRAAQTLARRGEPLFSSRIAAGGEDGHEQAEVPKGVQQTGGGIAADGEDGCEQGELSRLFSKLTEVVPRVACA